MSASTITGLAAIKKFKEEQAAKAAERERPKAEWLSSVFPKKTGDVLEGRFLQELDVDMENYDESRGVGFIAVEHQAPGPDGYKRRAKCTIDDGECYACERHKADYKAGWKQRQNLYINFLAVVDGEPKVFILSRNANSTFAESLIQEAIDEGSITNSMYRITKTGSGTQTQWLLKRLPKAELLDDSKVEVFDLNASAVREVEYAKQPEYYGAVYSEGNTEDNAGEDKASMGNSWGGSDPSVDW